MPLQESEVNASDGASAFWEREEGMVVEKIARRRRLKTKMEAIFVSQRMKVLWDSKLRFLN